MNNCGIFLNKTKSTATTGNQFSGDLISVCSITIPQSVSVPESRVRKSPDNVFCDSNIKVLMHFSSRLMGDTGPEARLHQQKITRCHSPVSGPSTFPHQEGLWPSS